jgi:hypothetical protein
MTIVQPTARALFAACLAVASLLAVAPRPASALEPPRPLPHYRPAFVTETDVRPWKDCLWASGAMLLDKWTNGARIVSHQRLRQLSGDASGGSDLADLADAYARVGIALRYSPDGGDRITWSSLLRRLSNGAGAILLGDDSKLPRWYGRWDYRFWKGKARTTNHAVYIERYDRAHGRVWLMDPLAPAGWGGEWISVSSLQRYAWSRGGLLFAAVTPTAKAAPFAGVTIAPPVLSQTSVAFDAAWPVDAPRRWHFQGADVRATFRRAADPLRAVVTAAPVVLQPGDGPAAARPSAKLVDGNLVVSARLPTTPGAYVGGVRLTDRRFGRRVADTGPVAVFVAGPRQARLEIGVADRAATAGSALDVSIHVTNTGPLTWADPPASLVARGTASIRGTRVVARWIPVADEAGTPVSDDVVPTTTELARTPLAPGGEVTLETTVRLPDAPGRWALVVDLVDDVDGSFAALGSAPASAWLDVVAPHGIDIVN